MSAPAIFRSLPKKRGHRAKLDGRERFNLFPNQRAGRHYIYAVCFVGGVVKIGKTYNPRGRVTDHWKTAEGQVLWAHVFEGGTEGYGRAAEAAALEAMEKIAARINRSEWFRTDADKRTVVMAIRPVLAGAKALAAKWDRERQAAAARQALASRLLAEHEAAKQRSAPTEPATAKAA